jgi:hypothetical protein
MKGTRVSVVSLAGILGALLIPSVAFSQEFNVGDEVL